MSQGPPSLLLLSLGVVLVVVLATSYSVDANPVQWTNWIGVVDNSAKVKKWIGNITLYDVNTWRTRIVQVTYSNSKNAISFIQTGQSTGGDWWNPSDLTFTAYVSDLVDNNPFFSEMIALNPAAEHTLEFSEPVSDLIFPFLSINANILMFNNDFDILSSGEGLQVNGHNCGQTGCGKLVKEHFNIDGVDKYYLEAYTGEPAGTLRFKGTFKTFTWSTLIDENWHSFTVGVLHEITRAVPVFWADWTDSSTTPQPTYNGQITIKSTSKSDQTISVSITTKKAIGWFQTLQSQPDWWQSAGRPASAYTSPFVGNDPWPAEALGLVPANTYKATFSRSVTGLVLAFNSLSHGNTFTFDQEFLIASVGSGENGNRCGYWGCGTGNVVYNSEKETYTLTTVSEFHGTIIFPGTFKELNFESSKDENWHALTLGLHADVNDVPSHIYWINWIKPIPVENSYLGYIDVGEDTLVQVKYNSPRGISFLANGVRSGYPEYWQSTKWPLLSSPFTSMKVANDPNPYQWIALVYKGSDTVYFSTPVTNPVIAYMAFSIVGQGVCFKTPFVLLSSSCTEGRKAGLWGCGSTKIEERTVGLNGKKYCVLKGDVGGEPSLTLQLPGTYSSIEIEATHDENWWAFAVGVQGATVGESGRFASVYNAIDADNNLVTTATGTLRLLGDTRVIPLSSVGGLVNLPSYLPDGNYQLEITANGYDKSTINGKVVGNARKSTASVNVVLHRVLPDEEARLANQYLVTDSVSGKVLKLGKATIEGGAYSQDLVGSSGIITIPTDVPDGDYTITFKSKGHDNKPVKVSVVAGSRKSSCSVTVGLSLRLPDEEDRLASTYLLEDSITKSPIKQGILTLTAEDFSLTITASSGTLVIPADIPDDDYTLKFTSSGYDSFTRSATVVSGCRRSTLEAINLDRVLPPDANRIAKSYVIVDAHTGDKVPASSLTISSSGYTKTIAAVASVVSIPKDLDDGDYTLTFFSTTYDNKIVTASIVNGCRKSATDPVEVPLTRILPPVTSRLSASYVVYQKETDIKVPTGTAKITNKDSYSETISFVEGRVTLPSKLPDGDFKIVFKSDGYTVSTVTGSVLSNVRSGREDVPVYLVLLPPDSARFANAYQVNDAQTGEAITATVTAVLANTVGGKAVTLTASSTGLLTLPDTLADGLYTLKFSASGFDETVYSGEVVENSRKAANPLPVFLSRKIKNTQKRLVLQWANPQVPDLDINLFTDDGTRIYWKFKKTNVPIKSTTAYLDIDAQKGYGPETISLSGLEPGMKYILAIFNFKSVPPVIGDSGARVTFYESGKSSVYEIPKGEQDITKRWWVVATFDSTGKITPINAIVSATSKATWDNFKGYIPRNA